MTIITRPDLNNIFEDEVKKQLLEILAIDSKVTFSSGYATRNNLNFSSSSDTLPAVIENVEFAIKTLYDLLAETSRLMDVLDFRCSDLQKNIDEMKERYDQLAQKTVKTVSFISSLRDVTYDGALDSAVTELVSSFEANGIIEVNADGDIRFDGDTNYVNQDLKSAMKNAISEWINSKVQ